MTWARGADRIRGMLVSGELVRVTANTELAARLLKQAQQALATAEFAIEIDAAYSAYAELYEATRKSLTAVLQIQGLRPTTKGGHIALVTAVTAQFGPSLGKILRPVDRMRATRNDSEYPDENTFIDMSTAEADLQKARAIVEACGEIVRHGLDVFVP